MASLPIPAKIYFNDFSFDLVTYSIKRNSEVIASAQGLSNKDEDGTHIGFLIDTDIKVGDVLISPYNESFVVSRIGYDTYNGNPEMIKAYY
ncbi:hypothetical protein [Bacillus sp. FJAT-52991]|uniref:Uncharacterized protein n=1 Tax=Bacillus kandeliae TaxID=3129297 RepID=A0ABZ2NAE3_9BACI